ncbi:MAG: transporter substrate-binding domain-containing protein [Rhodospirillales bacterium]|nr:transporter substrate-binding domain-containing protein [Rhodospirillales bacterium]
MKLFNIALALLFSMSLSISAALAETVSILGKSIPQLMTAQPDSMFHSIIVEVAKRADFKIKVEILPGKRALFMFNAGQGDVLVPVQLELMKPGPFKIPVIGSEPVMEQNRYIYSRKGKRPFRNLSELKGKRLGLVRGYKYGKHIDKNPDLKVFMVKDVGRLMQMLERDRLDAFIAFPNAIYRFSKILDVEKPTYDRLNPVAANNISFAFRDDPRGRRLRNLFSNTILEMKKDGTLERLTAPMRPK